MALKQILIFGNSEKEMNMIHPKTECLILPKTDKARWWLFAYADPGSQWLNGGLVVEHRFISGILERMKDLGLTEKDFDVMRRKKGGDPG